MNLHCPGCDGSNLSVLYTAQPFDIQANDTRHFTLARCQDCGLVGTADATEQEVSDAYTTSYYGSGAQKFSGVIESVIGWFATRRARAMMNLWRAGKAPTAVPVVLDIGCGRGTLLRAFRDLGASVVGLERSEFPVHESIDRFVHVGDLDDRELADRKFDIVVIWHVMEHLRAPESLLRQITNHMNAGGLLAVAVPDFGSWQQRMFTRHWFHLDLPRHLVHFESGWLLNLLGHHDFRLVRRSHFDPLQNTYGFVQSAMNAMFPAHRNELYAFLKRGELRLRTIPWLIIGALAMPIAMFECLLGAATGAGATLQLMARWEPHDK